MGQFASKAPQAPQAPQAQKQVANMDPAPAPVREEFPLIEQMMEGKFECTIGGHVYKNEINVNFIAKRYHTYPKSLFKYFETPNGRDNTFCREVESFLRALKSNLAVFPHNLEFEYKKCPYSCTETMADYGHSPGCQEGVSNFDNLKIPGAAEFRREELRDECDAYFANLAAYHEMSAS